jgi:hypothetical protein
LIFGVIPTTVGWYFSTYPNDLCDCEKAMNWHVISYENSVFDKDRVGKRCIYKYLYLNKEYEGCNYFDRSCRNYMIKKGVSSEELADVKTWNDRVIEGLENAAELGRISREPVENISDLGKNTDAMLKMLEKDSENQPFIMNSGVYGYLKMKGCRENIFS